MSGFNRYFNNKGYVMKNDGHSVGRILSRREALTILGGVGAAMLFGCKGEQSKHPNNPNLPCVVRPEQTEGPYFVDEMLNRSDIRSDPSNGTVKDGVPLQLTLNVYRISGDACIPLADAIVDIWHCDALGIYSDVKDPNFNTLGQKFLRGYQATDKNGTARFTTIYPGWYRGRTVHIHFKVRADSKSGRNYEFTSQFYFDDSITDRVHTQAPYSKKGQRTLRNNEDYIFRYGGEQLLLSLTTSKQGYTATFDIGLLIA